MAAGGCLGLADVLLAACEVYLQQIKPPPPDEASPASGPGNQAGLPSHISQT
jgi:hypothetical protein